MLVSWLIQRIKMHKSQKNIAIIFFFITSIVVGQEVVFNDSYSKAKELAYQGAYSAAKEILFDINYSQAKSLDADILLARTLSWTGDFEQARKKFNAITTKNRKNDIAWIAAIKIELYADNNPTALGLCNKALYYLKNNKTIERLKLLAQKRIENQPYPKKGWFNQPNTNDKVQSTKNQNKSSTTPKVKNKRNPGLLENTTKTVNEEPKNRVSIRNSFRVFDQRYDPMIASTIAYKRQTKYGSIIPKINYANRLGKQGVQYDLDLYPKLAKKIYAYINYGYSNAEIYPAHKVSGDIYFSLPGAIEFSAGGRYMVFENRNVKVLSNSLGHYRGNYYFSLRSYITPKIGNLTRISGGLVVRKYLRDGNNYMGISAGLGYSPELRQFFSDGNLLAETLLYIESQRLGVEYQFSTKANPSNVYRANLGITRQELSFDDGKFFLALSAGLTYNVNF